MSKNEILRISPSGSTHYFYNGYSYLVFVKKIGLFYELWSDVENKWINGSTSFECMRSASPNLKPL